MTLNDIIEAIANVVSTKTGYEVYAEWEEDAERESVYINCIEYSRQFVGTDRELLKASWDLTYFPNSANESRNKEIREALEKINLAFDHFGKKYLKVLDRSITLSLVNNRIVDNVGHYMFDTELFINYGEEKKYELMQELILKEEWNE